VYKRDALSYIYFSPVLAGKRISQNDISQFKGMSKEIADFKTQTGETTLWTNSMFGGMPSYLIATEYKGNLIKKIDNFLKIGIFPANMLFLLFLGFYAMLMALGTDKWLSIVGAIAFAFTSYNFIIIAAGHNSKAHTIAFMALVIAGILLVYNGRQLLGLAFTGLGLALQLVANHLQITYYTLIIVLIIGISYLIQYAKRKELWLFIKRSLLLLIPVTLALASNINQLWTVQEYSHYSIRGKSELTLNSHNKTSGLDKDYATAWSYGIAESFTLLIPNFMGGSSAGELPIESETFEFLSKAQGKINAKKSIQQMPTYWGSQPFTSGPVYVGSIMVFLFVLGLFIVDKKHRWWLLTATIVSLLLAWGKNVPNLTNFLLDHLPGYNKFRAVSMTLVIAQFTIPLLGILAADKIIKGNYDKKEILKGLKYSFGITAGLIIFFILFAKSLFTFEALNDERYLSQGATAFVDALQSDRAMLLRRDGIRSLIFIVLGFATLWLFVEQKLKKEYAIIALGFFIIVDMWAVDKRYLNNDNFISERKTDEPFTPSQADLFILQDKNPDYRVLNLTTDTFNDAGTSYFHKSIGGYHGAKMRRYQELIEHTIFPESQRLIKPLQAGNFNVIDSVLAKLSVLNMLNTKYIIINPQAQPLINNAALGNAWFVSDYKLVENSDEEIAELGKLNTKNKALIDKRYSQLISGINLSIDSTATILLETYQPNYLKYISKTNSEQLAVFSEIYYPKGWVATIDGEPTDHFRANYVLRAMLVPKGEHVIEFRFLPQSFIVGEKISLASSLILILLLLGIGGWELKKQLTEKED
jgi:hypothetical protein